MSNAVDRMEYKCKECGLDYYGNRRWIGEDYFLWTPGWWGDWTKFRTDWFGLKTADEQFCSEECRNKNADKLSGEEEIRKLEEKEREEEERKKREEEEREEERRKQAEIALRELPKKEEELTVCVRQLEEKKREVDAERQRADECERELKAKEREIREKEKEKERELEGKDVEIKGKDEEIRNLQHEIEGFQRENENFQREIEGFQRENENFQRENLELRRVVAAKDEEIERLRAQIKAPPPARTFKSTNFHRLYPATPMPEYQHDIFRPAVVIIKWFCRRHTIEEAVGVNLFKALQREAFEDIGLLLDEVPSACQRMWTSGQCLPNGTEFCSILNEAIRVDDENVMAEVLLFVRGINKLCVTSRMVVAHAEWPRDNRLYRGGGMPNEHQGFFVQGKEYRVGMYLSTSDNENVCKQNFCRRAQDPPILFIFQLHPVNHCVHVNYVSITNIPGEREFLFVPYSVFTVVEVHWRKDPTWLNPHVMVLDVAVDNQLCSEELPLAPWH